MAKREGPKVTTEKSCFDCKHCGTSHYACQGDSGCDVFCEHPEAPNMRTIGDTRWDTPDWCPVEREAGEVSDEH